MIPLTLTERYAQARLYAAQVRKRREMGEKYDHYKPTTSRRIVSAKLEEQPSLA